jgi:hypothetical protein
MNTRQKVFNPEPEVAIQLKPHKHCFSKECTKELEYFATLHKHDDRKTFKEAWQKWCNTNHEIINQECVANNRTDVLEKMFVSVRYYYRKKSDAKKEKKPRRKYVSLDPHFLAIMDKHLYSMICNNMNNKTMVSDTVPAYAFNTFCEQHTRDIDTYCENIDNNKLKKTFKNRYHMMKRTLSPIKTI